MQIVIDIPEGMYENALNNLFCGSTTLCNAIKNGTPLPKGHGDLIDTKDILYDDLECADGNIYMVVHAPCIDNAKVIIPADKEDAE